MAYYRITYGKFSAAYAKLQADEQTMYAEDGITQVGVHHSFSINGWLTSNTESGFATVLQDAKCEISKPRQAFTVQWSPDKVTWSTLWSFEPGADVDFGPKAEDLNIIQISGGKAAFYSVRVTVIDKQCYDGNCNPFDRPSDILSIVRRWEHNVDVNGLTRRTISGNLVVTSGSVTAGKDADCYRNTITPDVPTYFKRESQNFSQSENGRVLQFSFVDVEQMWTLPQPITNGNASLTIHVQPYGTLTDYSLSGRFEAPITVTKQVILDRINALVAATFPLAVQVTLIKGEWRITEGIYDNYIDFSVTAQAATAGQDPIAFLQSGIPYGAAPPGSTGQAQLVNPYGGIEGNSSGLVAGNPVARGYYDACTPSSSIGTAPAGFPLESNRGGGDSSSGNPTGPGNQQYVTANVVGPSTTQKSTPWIAYHEKWSYSYNPGIVIFDAKVEGLAPLVQRANNPRLTVTQAGYFKQMAQNANGVSPAPAPALGADGVLTYWAVTPTSSDQIGASAYNLYTIDWCYVMTYIKPIVPGTTGMDAIKVSIPEDPRVQAVVGGPIQDMPNLIG